MVLRESRHVWPLAERGARYLHFTMIYVFEKIKRRIKNSIDQNDHQYGNTFWNEWTRLCP